VANTQIVQSSLADFTDHTCKRDSNRLACDSLAEGNWLYHRAMALRFDSHRWEWLHCKGNVLDLLPELRSNIARGTKQKEDGKDQYEFT